MSAVSRLVIEGNLRRPGVKKGRRASLFTPGSKLPDRHTKAGTIRDEILLRCDPIGPFDRLSPCNTPRVTS